MCAARGPALAQHPGDSQVETLVDRLRAEAALSEEMDSSDSSVETMRAAALVLEEQARMIAELRRAAPAGFLRRPFSWIGLPWGGEP